MSDPGDITELNSLDLLSAFEDAVGDGTYPGRASAIEKMRIELWRRLEGVGRGGRKVAYISDDFLEELVKTDQPKIVLELAREVQRLRLILAPGPRVRKLVEEACAPVRASSSAEPDAEAVALLIELVKGRDG